jgi:glycosyltransferase involved in cell wall biosynthesis
VYFHPVSKQIADKNRKPCCTLIFCGLMDYYPNVDAVVWFVKEVLPRLRSKLGRVNFYVVGAKPAKEVLNLTAHIGVKVIGRVDDVRPHIWQAAISVAPIRIARGIQNKVLEAMAMAKPIVATEQAFEGIEAVPGRDLLVTKAEPEAYAEAITTLWEQPDLAENMAKNARRVVENRYDWNVRLEKLHALLFLKKL